MTKKDWLDALQILVLLSVVTCIGFALGLVGHAKWNNNKDREIAELNQTIGEYKINEEWFYDYVDVLEEIYEGKINEAVLEERIYWLERDNTFNDDNIDGYYLLEVVSRIRTRTGDAYVYTLRVYGSGETGTITSSQLFSVGEFVLGIETNDDEVYLIDFEN